MGNIFKPEPIKNHDLYKSLIQTNLIEKLIYLENKFDELDAKMWSLESNTQANIKVMSKDIHTLYEKIKK
tara:strand:+ start:167 stop:376 length:210 start_codon:yes stop_codon:yes gene_type:complete